MFKLPKSVKIILKQLHNAGYEAFIVGGCVRDMILNIEPHDFDITTSAEPEEVKEIFTKTIDTGIEHGTVTVMMAGEGYEVTTYRIDGNYLDSRHPESVAFTKSLREDLKRRDFTINAMAYNQEDGVIDLFNGKEDLQRGIIRCVGLPEERFNEDALRMLRAVRFGARFGFDIDPATEKAIMDRSAGIKHISAERIHVEMTKTLCSDHPEYIEKLVQYGLLPYIIPEFMPCVGMTQHHPYHIYNVDTHTYECLKHIPSEEGLRWAIYLHDIGKGYTKTTDSEDIDHFYGHVKVSTELSDQILRRLKFDNKTRKRVVSLVGFHDYRFENSRRNIRRAAAKIGIDLFSEYLQIQKADIMGQSPEKMSERLTDLDVKRGLFQDLLTENACVSIKDLAVNGQDLMMMGLPKGKVIGEILTYLLDKVIESPELNKKDLLLTEATRYLQERENHED